MTEKRVRPSPLLEVVEASLRPTLLELGFVGRGTGPFVLSGEGPIDRFVACVKGDVFFNLYSGIYIPALQALFDDLNADGLFPAGVKTTLAALKQPAHLLSNLEPRMDPSVRQARKDPYGADAAWSLYPEDETRQQHGERLARLWLRVSKPWLDRFVDLGFVAEQMRLLTPGGRERDLVVGAMASLAGDMPSAQRDLQLAFDRSKMPYSDRLVKARAILSDGSSRTVTEVSLANRGLERDRNIADMAERVARQFAISLH